MMIDALRLLVYFWFLVFILLAGSGHFEIGLCERLKISFFLLCFAFFSNKVSIERHKTMIKFAGGVAKITFIVSKLNLFLERIFKCLFHVIFSCHDLKSQISLQKSWSSYIKKLNCLMLALCCMFHLVRKVCLYVVWALFFFVLFQRGNVKKINWTIW